MVFPEYPRPQYTGLIGTGGITEAEISDTGGLMRMTFGSNSILRLSQACRDEGAAVVLTGRTREKLTKVGSQFENAA